ncbi:MAG: ABC transporter permease [Spirochaetota bacterium]
MATDITQAPTVALTKEQMRYTRRKRLDRSKYLYVLLAAPVLYFLMFRYAPMFGLVIAFKDYNVFLGMIESEWVGLENFHDIFTSPDFWQVFRNTLIISLYKIVAGFPVPIVLALLMNEMRSVKFRRLTQTVLYLPYFISWTVIGTIILVIFSPTTGFMSQVSVWLTGGSRLNLLASRQYFRGILVITDIWKTAGWGTIIYLAALSTIDPQLYEAAIVDGANRWQQIWRITIPSIMGVIVLLLIMRIGWIMYAGFEQILVLQNPVVRDVSDIFDTYVYRVGLGRGQYSFTATAELFKSVTGLILIFGADRFAKVMGEEGLL